jgi:hypothetical protein
MDTEELVTSLRNDQLAGKRLFGCVKVSLILETFTSKILSL